LTPAASARYNTVFPNAPGIYRGTLLIPLPPLSSLLNSLVALFPIGIYCLVLARINRRPHPLLVPGVHDAAGLLLALSGVLFFVCPSILTGFNYRPRDIWLYDHFSSLRALGDHWLWVWHLSLWLLYGFAVLGGSFLLMRSRRLTTAVYNVEPAALEETLGRVLDRLGLEWSRAGRNLLFRYGSVATDLPRREPLSVPSGPAPLTQAVVPNGQGKRGITRSVSAAGAAQAALDSPDPRYLLEVNAWSRLRHATLQWSPEAEPFRARIEAHLADALAKVWTRNNPAGNCLMAFSACLFVSLFFLTVLYQYARLLSGGW
jgi:hypothetical protein